MVVLHFRLFLSLPLYTGLYVDIPTINPVLFLLLFLFLPIYKQ
jgi:hypothetical protein